MKIIENVRKNTPLIHCITNYVTVNDVANIILAAGGSPIMADDVNEVEDMQSICSGLVINIGTLNERTITSMIMAGKKANACGHPVILDPVGVGASKLRTETAYKLLQEVKFAVIRGNLSEIKSLTFGSGKTKGVDACEADVITDENLDSIIAYAKELSARTEAIIVITGAIDIITDTKKTYITRNGDPLMGKITGTGCMLTGVICGYLAANMNNKLEAATMAVAAMGYCGETAKGNLTVGQGLGSYHMGILDVMSNLTDEVLEAGHKIEIR